ncbi:hypothetical protein F7725_009666 [Dissostichus mawsoni]|uniref:Uncharacterized protein n=1 Tax=Dissostichus mawsoni TaxID=36200 RepID=A0A7J5XPA5_DISMA|nr:hypothetical protein F7725_009666 [Dissostichus mawsoni]
MVSKLDARLKVRLARLQWESERDFQLKRELEIRKLDADTAFQDAFRKARNRRATHAHSVSPPGPKTKRLCFLCLDPGHLVAGCLAWKQQVAASKQSMVKQKDQHPVAMRQSGDLPLSSVSVCGSAVAVPVSEAVGVDLAQSGVICVQ